MKKRTILKSLALITGVFALPQIYYKQKHRQLSASDKVLNIIEIANNEYHLTVSKDFPLFVKVYDVPNPKGVVQIVHGAMEHQGRYSDVISFLNEEGYAVIAHDHRGHGRSVNEQYPKGVLHGADELIEDMYAVTRFARDLYSDIPLIMLGHSMGSMLVRLYLQRYEQMIDKVILTGVPPYNALSPVGVAVGRMINLYQGEQEYNDLLNVFPETIDWISCNQAHLEKIQEDPLAMGRFTNSGNLTLFEINRALKYPMNFKTQYPTLPMLLLAGEDDVFVAGLSGLRHSIGLLQGAGYINVYSKLYPNMRHEILHEINNQEVFDDILEFIENVK